MPTVLIVEDEEALLENLARFLRSFPGESRVLTSTNGEDGLQQLATEPDIDVLVTDVFLPGIDGLEVIRRAGRARPELPVVVTSAYGSTRVRRVALAHAISRFIDKPIDLDEFRTAILDAVSFPRDEMLEVATIGLDGVVRGLAERRATAVLCYRSGSRSGTLVLRSGSLTSCATEVDDGLEALAAMLAWPRGRAHRVAGSSCAPLPANVDLPPQALLATLGARP